ncbi:MAG: hypothetical protein WBE10_13570, partial [Candidatus Acidiferrum sp.]
PSLSPKDRVSLCLFTYEDGRRCRTPRIASHPHFCFYHAQKESQSQAAATLGKDLAYFFSGDYLSACDLNTALSRLIPAVIRGEIKPRLARTVAYMFQTLLQSTHLAQHEYINAFGTDGWRKAVRNSVNSNSDYLFPPDPNAAPKPSQPHPPDRATRSQAPTQGATPPPSPSPVRPASSTSVGAGLARPDSPGRPDQPTQPQSRPQQTAAAPPPPSAISTPQPPPAVRPSPADAEAALNVARSLFPPHHNATVAIPTQPEPTVPAVTACHPERSEGPRQAPIAPITDETRPRSNPHPAQPPAPTRHSIAPTRDPYAVHYGPNYRLLIDGKPW